jgi:hypothetical protein
MKLFVQGLIGKNWTNLMVLDGAKAWKFQVDEYCDNL